MSWDVGTWDTGYFNPVLVGVVSGLKLYKCVYWVESGSHGGDISDNEVDVLFDYISYDQNVSGYTDYRKCHLKNVGATTGDKVLRPALFLPPGLSDRLTIEIAAGQDYDDMSSKPADEQFSSSLSINLGNGAYQPFWLKRTISAGGENPGYYLNVPVSIVVSES